MPFIYFAIVHPSLQTLVWFQGYLLTATAVGVIGIKNRAVLRQKWFWRAMACSLPVHTAAIAGIYYWDKANLASGPDYAEIGNVESTKGLYR
jgi:hypothetical protein